MKNNRRVDVAVYFEAAIFAFSALLAYIALVYTAGNRIDLENLAKGEQNTSRIEFHKGVPYTAYKVKDIQSLITRRAASNRESNYILWLGNSQLHYINQYREGDHLAPFWLRHAWRDSEDVAPLGCSLPNVNIQEYLVLSRYAAMKIPLNLLVAELVFDDMREDDLRADFSDILVPGTVAEIQHGSKTAESIVNRFLASVEMDEENKDTLTNTLQRPVEHWLNDRLSVSWKLWADRPQIEGNVLLALYNLRNWVFGIKPTTVRKMIQVRYEHNMDALRDILDDFRRRGIPVLLYIAPIRQDKPIPYDGSEYSRWKGEVDALARRYGARLVNLEKLVPDNNWGAYTGDDIDFMHFQGAGHRLVAEALLPQIEDMLGGGKR